jgi:hypothetical protein
MSYGWNVPDAVASAVIIRITDGANVTGTSGVFSIVEPGVDGSINSLTLTGLTNNNIGNNQNLNIAWTYTPGLGPMMMISFGLESSVATGAAGSVQPSARAPRARARTRARRGDRIARARLPSRECVLRRMKPPEFAWAKTGVGLRLDRRRHRPNADTKARVRLLSHPRAA